MKYHLTEACQNAFILFDVLQEKGVDPLFLEKAQGCLKKEGRDDALILINGENQGETFMAQMIVLGLDGKIAEFCGNGARAVAAYLFSHFPGCRKIFLKSHLGMIPLLKQGENRYSVTLPGANFTVNPKFITDPKKLGEYRYVETGEPHLTIEKEMDDETLFHLGKTLNAEKELFPCGINVNAWHVLKEGHIHVKTYERGVQRLTRSCGTGSMACAAIYRGQDEIAVTTPGGLLNIRFTKEGIELCGEAL